MKEEEYEASMARQHSMPAILRLYSISLCELIEAMLQKNNRKDND